MTQLRILPHATRHQWRGITVRSGGRAVSFGSSATMSDVKIVDAHGGAATHVSRRAGVLAVRGGQALVQNLSERHALVVRRWGYGDMGDVVLPAARESGSPRVQTLRDGLWWVRNGRSDTRSGAERAPTDAETCWLLVEVREGDAPVGVAPEGRRVTSPLNDLPPPLGSVSLTEAQLIAFAAIFGQFLASPPSVAPQALSDAELRSASGIDYSQRRSDIRRAAAAVGWVGTVDAAMLAWMLTEKHIGYSTLARSEKVRAELGLIELATPW